MNGLKHNEDELLIKLAKYSNGTPAIQLVTTEGSPYVMLSTNLGSKSQDQTHIFVKDYDVHAEIVESMEKLGLLILTEISEQSGFNNYRLYQLTDLLFKNAEKL